jgi:hypothetical protein
MASHARWALLVPVAWVGLTAAQPPAGKEADRPAEAEVRMADGSAVRVHILQASLDVQTKYGKLTIPLREVRRIDFGLHMSEAARQRIDAAVGQLGSGTYKVREQAMRELVGHGALALPALRRAGKSDNAEVSHRAEKALDEIRTKYPEEARRDRSEDLIETKEFPVVGIILSPSIKARSPYFGEVELRLTELRQMRFRGAAGDADMRIDAQKYGSAQDQWMDTGYDVTPRSRLKIAAAGLVDLWPQTPGQYMSSPKGYGNTPQRGTALPGQLIGRIGASGTVFNIGEKYEAAPGEHGRLFLHIVPSPWNNAASGSYMVQVATSLTGFGWSGEHASARIAP